MPAYAFEALDAQGKSRKGLIEADTARAARNLLPVSYTHLTLPTILLV